MTKWYEVVCICPASDAWNSKSWRVPAKNEDEACDRVLEDLEMWWQSNKKATLPTRQHLQAYRVS